ncbi:hypothetical protein SAMN02799631_00387 [Methylobacterium sp. 174MFSha1.1]|uniref:hypothetical protein n=1 Tax=Methylobacterium sp. 174MFSha1.1 TaxID=1502749 RepID=UPI0008DF795A|nr:hypothetical protein [Methylobacterium sp. 174MFSha1.1]SFU38857.1 hypothetical protein SAMN02799631_00387 [Methylobacterium sp. 174MFSha1.1]
MTAINAIVRRDRIHLMTDGAVYNPEGQVTGITQKVHILAHLSTVVAYRGPTWFGGGFATLLNSANLVDFDDLLSQVIPLTHAYLQNGLNGLPADAVAEAGIRLDLKRVEVILAGWSHRRGRGELYELNTERPEWQLEPKGVGVIMPGNNPELIARLEAHGWCPEDEAQDVPNLLALLQHQRAVPDILPNGMRARTVGAFAQHTMITPGGIVTRIVERWDDLPGGAR